MYGLDLFSGIGGITKALDGYVQPVAYCENDRYAQGVLLSRMFSGDIPTAPLWDDVRTLRPLDLQYQPNIIYGGFPCQDISVAGHGKGLGGERSGLFFEIIRLVGDIRPTFIFLENVPAIRTRGADIVCGRLASLGYDSRWLCLSAAEVGAPHLRKRWFLLAHANRASGWVQPVAWRKFQAEAFLRDNGAKEPMADAAIQGQFRLSRSEKAKYACFGTTGESIGRNIWWEIESNVGRVANGIPKRVDRLRTLGNAVVPAQAREAFERLMGLK